MKEKEKIDFEPIKKEVKSIIKQKQLDNWDLLIVEKDWKKGIVIVDVNTWEQVDFVDLSKKDSQVFELIKNNFEKIKSEIQQELSNLKKEIITSSANKPEKPSAIGILDDGKVTVEDLEKLSPEELLFIFEKSENLQTINTILLAFKEKLRQDLVLLYSKEKFKKYAELVKKIEKKFLNWDKEKFNRLVSLLRIALVLNMHNEQDYKLLGEDFVKETLFVYLPNDKNFVIEYNYQRKKFEHQIRPGQWNNPKETIVGFNALKSTLQKVYKDLYPITEANVYFNSILIRLKGSEYFFDKINKKLQQVYENLPNTEKTKLLTEKYGIIGWLSKWLESYAWLVNEKDRRTLIWGLIVVGAFVGFVAIAKKLGFWRAVWALLLWVLGIAWFKYLNKEIFTQQAYEKAPESLKQIDPNKEIIPALEFIKLFDETFTVAELLNFIKNENYDIDGLFKNTKEKNPVLYKILNKFWKKTAKEYITKALAILWYVKIENWKIKIVKKENKSIEEVVKNFEKKVQSGKVAIVSHSKVVNDKDNVDRANLSVSQSDLLGKDNKEKSSQDVEIKVLAKVPVVVDTKENLVWNVKEKYTIEFDPKLADVIFSRESLDKMSVKERVEFFLTYILDIWQSKINNIISQSWEQHSGWLLTWAQRWKKEEFIKSIENIRTKIDIKLKELKQAKDINQVKRIAKDIIDILKEANEVGNINSTIFDDLDRLKKVFEDVDEMEPYEAFVRINDALRWWFLDDGASLEVQAKLKDFILTEPWLKEKFNDVLSFIANLQKEIIEKGVDNPFLLKKEIIFSNWQRIEKILGLDDKKLYDFIKNKILSQYPDFPQDKIGEISKYIYESMSVVVRRINEKIEKLQKEKCEGLMWYEKDSCLYYMAKLCNDEFLLAFASITWFLIEQYVFDYKLKKLDTSDLNSKHKKIVKLYKDIAGIGWLNPSDKNEEFLIDMLVTIWLLATEFGFIIWLGRLAVWSVRTMFYLDRLAKWWRIARITAGTVETIAMWVGNMAGYHLAENLLFDFEDLKSWPCFDWEFFKELAKWIGYAWVFRLVGPIYSKFKLLGISPNDRFIYKGWKLFLQAGWDAIALSLTDLGIEKLFDTLWVVEWEYEITASQLLELATFAFLMRLAGYKYESLSNFGAKQSEEAIKIRDKLKDFVKIKKLPGKIKSIKFNREKNILKPGKIDKITLRKQKKQIDKFINNIKSLEKQYNQLNKLVEDLSKVARNENALSENIIKQLEQLWYKKQAKKLQSMLDNWNIDINYINKITGELSKKSSKIKDTIKKEKLKLKSELKEYRKNVEYSIRNNIDKVKFKKPLELQINGEIKRFTEWTRFKLKDWDYIVLKDESWKKFVAKVKFEQNQMSVLKVSSVDKFVKEKYIQLRKAVEEIVKQKSFVETLLYKLGGNTKDKIVKLLKEGKEDKAKELFFKALTWKTWSEIKQLNSAAEKVKLWWKIMWNLAIYTVLEALMSAYVEHDWIDKSSIILYYVVTNLLWIKWLIWVGVIKVITANWDSIKSFLTNEKHTVEVIK